jgi:hypothetical protein
MTIPHIAPDFVTLRFIGAGWRETRFDDFLFQGALYRAIPHSIAMHSRFNQARNIALYESGAIFGAVTQYVAASVLWREMVL